jgi:glycosyl transferase family 1
MLSATVSAKLSSLVWRSLTRYGRIKYRYMLPAYRFLRLMPNKQKLQGTKNPSRALRGAQALVRTLGRYGADFYREQLNSVVARVSESRGAVIFLPSVGWKIINTQRTHHLAREFSRQGYVSIFDATNQYDDVNGFREVEPNLFLFRADPELLCKIPNPILWSLSYNYDRIDAYPKGCHTVYDWIDELAVFPYDRGFLDLNHARALKEASLVASVAHVLHERARADRPDALYLPNGVEYERFANASESAESRRDIARLRCEGKPIAGYYGALAEWFDYELLAAVACLRPDWNFLLIGPKYDISMSDRGRMLLRLPNVRWIGHRSYESLPAYLGAFDVAMIPFVINGITLATSPLKLYEYFAGGKAVVSTPLPECAAFQEVFIASDAEGFSRALVQARKEGQNNVFVKRLEAIGRENSWKARVQLVTKHLDRVRAKTGKTISAPGETNDRD